MWRPSAIDDDHHSRWQTNRPSGSAGVLLPEPESLPVQKVIVEERDVLVSALVELEAEVQLQGGWLSGTFKRIQYRRLVQRMHELAKPRCFLSPVTMQSASLAAFAWQRGYGAFSVGPSDRDALFRYIDEQEEHHRTRTFQDEYWAFP